MGRSTTGTSNPTRERIGDMLVALGLITQAQLEEALATQSSDRLGKRLTQLGYVSETRLIQALSNQLSVPWVSLERVNFSAALLSRISSDLADRHTVIPVYVRSGRGLPETLYVAMDDPTDELAIGEITRSARVRVRPMIAAPSEIRRAIEERYFGAATTEFTSPQAALKAAEEASQVAARPEPTRAPKRENKPAARAPARVPPPPPGKPAALKDGAVPVEKYAAPSSPPEAAARTLTFLDGTQLRLPSAQKRSPGQLPVTRVRHVVKAVTAAHHDLPGDGLRWDDVVQAVLDALKSRGVTLTRAEVAAAWSTLRDKALQHAEKSAPAEGKGDKPEKAGAR